MQYVDDDDTRMSFSASDALLSFLDTRMSGATVSVESEHTEEQTSTSSIHFKACVSLVLTNRGHNLTWVIVLLPACSPRAHDPLCLSR